METELRRSIKSGKPNPRYANAALAEDISEPVLFEESSKKKEWVRATEEELQALKENQIWELVRKPRNVKPISCIWVYKVKTRPDGSVIYRAQHFEIRGIPKKTWYNIQGIAHEESVLRGSVRSQH